MDKSLIAALILFPLTAFGQTHTFPGNNVFPSTSTTDFASGSTVDFTGATVTGLAGGAVSSVFTRTGAVVAASGDYSAFYQPLDTDLTAWAAKTAYAGTLTITTGKTFNVTNTLTLSGTDGSTLTIGAGGTLGTAAYTASSAYEAPITFSTGLTRSTNTVTVNTSQNIAKLSNLTTNGFVKTGSSDGTLSVDTATYQASDSDLTTWAGITPVAAVGTWIATPSSANLLAAMTNETGTGLLMFATSPDITTGFTIGGAAASRKMIVGDGTKFGPSTETYAVPGTAGNYMMSDGTNWTSVAGASVWMGGSGTGTGASCCTNTNTLIPGSVITIPAGTWKVGGSYHAVFDMLKTGAGSGTLAVNIHMGTLGTTSDAIVATATFTAGTAVVDSGLFDAYVTFRSVGSGTSAVIYPVVRLMKVGTTTGLVNSGSIWATAGGAASSGFNSTTQTKMSVSVNGGASFSGTNAFCQAEYKQ